MKYAAEVMGLLLSKPPRAHRMAALVRAVAGKRPISQRQRNAMRQGILRVLDALRDGGHVEFTRHSRNSIEYQWAHSAAAQAAPETTGKTTA